MQYSGAQTGATGRPTESEPRDDRGDNVRPARRVPRPREPTHRVPRLREGETAENPPNRVEPGPPRDWRKGPAGGPGTAAALTYRTPFSRPITKARFLNKARAARLSIDESRGGTLVEPRRPAHARGD